MRGFRWVVVSRLAAVLCFCEVALVARLAVLGGVAAFVFVVRWPPPPQAASTINPTAARMVLVMRASTSGVVPI
ncbi:MAG: hypothetical protein DMD73_04080 [Gemmatimonadetes bacterium]|nr:MAG: hypothetical protein DMD73_04080 [Gemmatimonadota bacterium]